MSNLDANKLISPIRKELYGQLEELKHQHVLSTPYSHVVLDNLMKHDRFRKLVSESVNTIKCNFKETDLFKVYQSMDLASINDYSTNYELLSLKKTIYSKKFRKFISEILGCGELIDRLDCSMNAYSNGGHLLCHDDVIGTRCVSYIIYLNDLDEPWLPTEGGALELYSLDESTIIDHGKIGGKQGLPQSVPSKSILPKSNTMVLFTVQPGRSYHSVQEVFSLSRPRLSISGWYHANDIPIGSDFASLSQIMSKTITQKVYLPIFLPLKNNNLLNNKELNYLSMYINPIYLTNESIKKLNKKFCKYSSIKLCDFLSNNLITSISNVLNQRDIEDKLGNSVIPSDYFIGQSCDNFGSWELIGPPHISRYLRYNHIKMNPSLNQRNVTCGQWLQIIKNLQKRKPFIKYLQLLTSLHIKGYNSEIRRFRPGIDYTVAYYKNMVKESKLDCTLCFVNDNEDAWYDGEVGGFECYIESSLDDNDQSAEAAEVYQSNNDDDNSQLLSISPENNMLSLVMRDENVMKFVKYVSFNAPSCRWDITTEYDLNLNQTYTDGDDDSSEYVTSSSDDDNSNIDNEMDDEDNSL